MTQHSQYENTPRENPLNPVKRESELLGKKMILSELINAAERVGSEVITVKAMRRILEGLV
jgi:hypothetical protein